MEDKEYALFVQKFHRYSGIDLALYKEAQMNRRLRTLFKKRGFERYDDYFYHVQKNQEAYLELIDRMTINVTEFYRNKQRWEILENVVIPYLLKEKSALKCWSAACSTGEEAYTLVMTLNRYLPFHRIHVLATDIDETVLEGAKKGAYEENALKGCEEEQIKKHFTKDENGRYHVKDEVKRCVTFKKHNLLQDTFEEDYDLIICRNAMIYFTEAAKELLYRKFRDALSETGVFFVGSTEQIFNPKKYGFEVFDAFFYRKHV